MPVSFFPSGGEVDEKPATTAKKRRRRQNDEITELGELLPYTLDVSGSLDKLSILRLTTSYIRFQNFMTLAYGGGGAHKESVLSNLIDQAMDGFMMVVASDGVILYASDNIETFVALNPRDVIGHSLHDLVQSDQDRDTISSNLKPKGNHLNQHRMFYIRLRNAVTPGCVRVSRYNTNLMLQVSGHLKVVQDHSLNITFSKLSPELAADPEFADFKVPLKPHVLGLIVECRPIDSSPAILELNVPQSSFTSTIGLDMKIQSVDTRVKDILGFNPEHFVGSAMKDYFHPLDHARLIPCKKLLQMTGYAISPTFRFMTASGDWTWVQMEGTMRFDKETHTPKHLDIVLKIVSQSEGTLRYIEQKEFYSHGKTQNSLAILHRDPYDNLVPDNPVPQTHKPIMEGLQGASVRDPAIDAVLHGREIGLSQLPRLMADIVSGEEEAVKLEAKNMERLKKIDFSKFKDGEPINPMCIMHLLKAVRDEEEGGGEGCGLPPGDFSPPQSVSSAPSPASSLASHPSSVSVLTPPSVVAVDNHVPSPHSVSASPHSVSGVGFVQSPHSAGSIPSPHSATGLIPSPASSAALSPYSVPPSAMFGTASGQVDTPSPDSGIDSPTSAGSDSTSTFQPPQVPNTHVSIPPVSHSPVSGPNSYQFQPQTTNPPSAFDFTTQQQLLQHQLQLQQQQQQGVMFPQPPAVGSLPLSTADQTLEMLLTNLSTPQQQQQFPPPQDWVEKQSELQEQILRQRNLLQDLLIQQEVHQMTVPAFPEQQPVYGHVVPNGSLSSLTPSPSFLAHSGPLSSLTPSPSPSSLVNAPTNPGPQNFGQYQPLPPQVTNSGQNGLNHTTSGTSHGSVSFVGSVDMVSSGTTMDGLSPPSPDIQELLQQFQ